MKKLPHELFPDILKWEIGDKLSDIGTWSWIFLGVNSDCIVFYEYLDGTKSSCSLKKAMRKFHNWSLKNREVEKSSLSVKDYNIFVRDFQREYEKIKKA